MKRTLLLAGIACFSLFTAKAQLANTKWKGTLKLPTQDGTLAPFGVTWDFQKDTASILYDSGNIPDVMVYWADKDMITFKKVSGSVPCDTAAVLTCSYQIKNDQLFLKQTQDACKVRSQVDASQPFDRVK